MNNKKSAPAINVALVIYDHMLATSVSLPVEMLRAAEAIALRESTSNRPLHIELVAEKKHAVSTRALIKLEPNATFDDAESPDFIFIPSLWRNPRPIIKKHPTLISWLNHQWTTGTTLIGGGTGVCFIAEAGLLENHPATTHWHYVKQFQRDYPNVDLKPDFFITQSERIYCAASLNALADIVVHLIEQIYGRATAQQVELNFSHEIRKPYEEQRYLEGNADRHPDELISQIQFWMSKNLPSSMSLAEIGAQFDISERSLSRRFKAAIGQQPSQYWRQLRIDMAKDLLTSSNLSILEISYLVGYQDQSHLSKLFKQATGHSPKDYRGMVRKKLFTQE